jgi:hypothetical protein
MDAISGFTALFNNLLNVLVAVSIPAAALFFGWGAVTYMSAGGSSKQMENGKMAMFNSVAGLALVLLAKVVISTIQAALGH